MNTTVRWVRQICKQLSKQNTVVALKGMYLGSAKGMERSDFQVTAYQKVLLSGPHLHVFGTHDHSIL